MRAFIFAFCLLPLGAAPGAALAETILASSKITAVTVYATGALVTREVRFDAPAGAHELLVTDLPAETEPSYLRMQAEGVNLGAFALRTDRLPPREVVLTPVQEAAKAEVERLEVLAQDAGAGLARIDAAVAAAEAQAGFLAGIKAEGEALTAEGLKSIAQMIGAEVLAARQAALAANAPRPAAEKALREAEEALEKARAALAALDRGDVAYAALSVQFSAEAAGPGVVRVSHYVEAGWLPVYDINLTRIGDDALEISRGVAVSQYSGEDWTAVALTLSTAQLDQPSDASVLWIDRREIYDIEAERLRAEADRLSEEATGMGGTIEPMMEAELVVEAAMMATMAYEGDVVVYSYPVPVDVASGVENLRLALDKLRFAARVEARAVPREDETAFMLAHFSNESPEIILPGPVFLLREGVLVGSTELEAIAPNVEAALGFGVIEGLRLTRDEPERAEGDRGFLVTSTQLAEKAVLQVENLTDEAWPVRLLDRVPYSEQEDLSVTFTAEPAASEENVDGERGILAWDFDLAPGEKKAISLTHVLSWPEGMGLR